MKQKSHSVRPRNSNRSEENVVDGIDGCAGEDGEGSVKRRRVRLDRDTEVEVVTGSEETREEQKGQEECQPCQEEGIAPIVVRSPRRAIW